MEKKKFKSCVDKFGEELNSLMRKLTPLSPSEIRRKHNKEAECLIFSAEYDIDCNYFGSAKDKLDNASSIKCDESLIRRRINVEKRLENAEMDFDARGWVQDVKRARNIIVEEIRRAKAPLSADCLPKLVAAYIYVYTTKPEQSIPKAESDKDFIILFCDVCFLLLKKASENARYPETFNLISIEKQKVQNLQNRESNKYNQLKIAEYIARDNIRAKNSMNKGDFQEACKIYDNMIITVGDMQSLKTIVYTMKKEFLEKWYGRLKETGNESLNKKIFDEATKNFEQAKSLAVNNPSLLHRRYIDEMNRCIDSTSDTKAISLRTEARRLANEKNLAEAILKLEEASKCAKHSSTIHSIELDKFKFSKRENDSKRIKELVKQANDSLAANKFDDAIRYFEQALEFAYDEPLLESITKDRLNTINKYTKFLQDEANKLVAQNKYEEAYGMFKKAYERARDTDQVESIKKNQNNAYNMQIKYLQQQANKLISENKFEEAQKIFEKASNINGDHSLVASVIADRAKAYNIQGLMCLKQGFDLDSKEPYTEQQAKEAREKFNFAKTVFQKADELNHTEEYLKNNDIACCKIYGDDNFNKALSLEHDAYTTYEEAKKTKNEDKYSLAKDKYQAVLDGYTTAKYHFDEGLRLKRNEFKDSIKVVSQQIATISKVIKGMDMIRLWCVYQKNEVLYAEKIKNAVS